MDKYLMPGAVVFAALVGAFMFRYEIQPVAERPVLLLIHDRWTGSAKICGDEPSRMRCFPYLRSWYQPIKAAPN